MSHEPACDEAWKWPDFMSGRGIEDEDCWMCGLLRRTRAEALRQAREAVAAFLYSVDDDVESILAAIDALKGEQT